MRTFTGVLFTVPKAAVAVGVERSLRSFSMLPPPYGPKQVTAGKSYPSSPLSQPAVSLRSTYIAWTSLRMPLSERFNAL